MPNRPSAEVLATPERRIAKAHARGVKPILATITPFKGMLLDLEGEQTRRAIDLNLLR